MSTRETVSFSLIVPMYEAAEYLPDLLDSFERQTPGPYTVEYLFVDDGSPDESAQIASEWLARTGATGRVIAQPNRGVSAARNAGLVAARGDWIGMPDSDDFLGRDYLASVARAVALAGDDVVLASTNVKWYSEEKRQVTDNHVLRFKFANGTTIIDLDTAPDAIQSQAASAFFRRDIIEDLNLSFVESLDIAEDTVFVGRYLSGAPSRRVAAVAGAHYMYRRRASGTSATDTAKTNPDFYFGRFERGYLPLFRDVAAEGPVPTWMQVMFLYDLRWFFPRENVVHQKATHLTAAEKQRVLDLVAEGLSYVSPRTVEEYNVTWLGVDYRCFFLALMGAPVPRAGTAKVVGTDGRDLELRYLFTGDLPAERFTRAGSDLEPVTAKTRRLDWFGQTLLHERIVWLPGTEPVQLTLNGEAVSLEGGEYRPHRVPAARHSGMKPPPVYSPKRYRPLLRRIARRARAEFLALAPRLAKSDPDLARRAAVLRAKHQAQLASLFRLDRRYRNAWLLMDKVNAGGDSAEYVYRRLRSQEPQLNTWFVVSKTGGDWHRLQTAGFKLLEYGSRRHFQALRNARVVISSHLDVEMTEPVPAHFYPERQRPWKYVYLQHGVLQHDLSTWFNRKPIALITTASVDEHRSIVEDGSAYVLTTKQAKLTGLPRHDEVLRLASSIRAGDKNIVLLAPTWRNHLLAPKTAPGVTRELKRPLEETDFGRNWLALANHPALKQAAESKGARIVFLPHPNFRSQIDPGLVSPHVDLIRETIDVHELLTRCRCVITDYSSIFFEAALAGADVSYFQFDREEFLHGGHTYVPGYWSYEDHGFGPVALDLRAAVTILTQQLSGEADAEREFYRDRVHRTLPMVDGNSADRVIAEVKNLLGED